MTVPLGSTGSIEERERERERERRRRETQERETQERETQERDAGESRERVMLTSGSDLHSNAFEGEWPQLEGAPALDVLYV